METFEEFYGAQKEIVEAKREDYLTEMRRLGMMAIKSYLAQSGITLHWSDGRKMEGGDLDDTLKDIFNAASEGIA